MQSFIKATLGCIRDKTGSILCLSGTRIKLKKKEFSESWTRFSLFFALFARVDNFLNVKYAEKTSRYCSNHFSNLHHTTGTYIHATSSITSCFAKNACISVPIIPSKVFQPTNWPLASASRFERIIGTEISTHMFLAK